MTNLILSVVAALCIVESGNNPTAIGDGGRAVGILQQWKINVDEANRLAGRKLWSYEDRLEPQKAKAMCFLILKHYYNQGTTDPVELGGRWRNPNGNAPDWYLNRIREALEERR